MDTLSLTKKEKKKKKKSNREKTVSSPSGTKKTDQLHVKNETRTLSNHQAHKINSKWISSVQFSCSVMSDSL